MKYIGLVSGAEIEPDTVPLLTVKSVPSSEINTSLSKLPKKSQGVSAKKLNIPPFGKLAVYSVSKDAVMCPAAT